MKKTARVMAMVAAAGVTGCESDFLILDDGDARGVANPPDLSTPVKTDEISQITTPEVDILWVIDDSGSMAEEQAALIESFPAFMEFFVDSGLDWHVGVVSTDTDNPAKNGKLQGTRQVRFLDRTSPDPVSLFAQMAALGTNGSPDERGRRAVERALTDPLRSGYNAEFYRDNASLHIIVISDEPDASDNQPTSNEFINFLQSLKPDPEMLTFSAVVAPREGCATASFPGTDYIRVQEAVGGQFQNICRDDWVPILEALGLQASGLKREYFLSDVPVPGTLNVWVIDKGYQYAGIDKARIDAGADPDELCETSSCFTYEYNVSRNSINLLDYVPSPLAKINIKYELLSGQEPGDVNDVLE